MSLVMKAALGGAAEKLYVDDVFSAYTYTGNGSTQTITNGIDLAGKGGLVWHKSRGVARGHVLFTTALGENAFLSSNSTAGPAGAGVDSYFNFNSDGFSYPTTSNFNNLNELYASWTFRKAPKFFDVVTFTTSASTNTNQRISHSLGQAPGMIILKATGATSGWIVWHRSLTDQTNYYLLLNDTAAQTNYSNCFGTSVPTTTDFGINTNFLGTSQAMVAYIFAHDTSTDGIIQCGSFTGNGSTNEISLGWEPQFVILKKSSAVSDWYMFDSMRWWSVGGNEALLRCNLSNTETSSSDFGYPTATGFVENSNLVANGQTCIYLAIRRPNKPPTVGTQVYNAIARTGTSAVATVTGVGFAPDAVLTKVRSGASYNSNIVSRLTNSLVIIGSTSGESANTGITSMTNDGFVLDTYVGTNTSQPIIHFAFKRSPEFFDVVCYTGTGSVHTETHNLGVAPELMIIKRRNGTGTWYVLCSALGNADLYLKFNLTDATNSLSTIINSTFPTASVFTVGTNTDVNYGGNTYITYLFATKAGISKVGSYTGNGSNQTINCGFTAGAKFILIKRTSSSGDWYVWDSVRGIVADNDPRISLNTTATEVTTDDSIDTDSSGFIVNQVSATNINVTDATYIFLAIA